MSDSVCPAHLVKGGTSRFTSSNSFLKCYLAMSPASRPGQAPLRPVPVKEELDEAGPRVSGACVGTVAEML